MECFALLAGCDYTVRRHVQMEAVRSGTRFIVAPSGGLKDIVEDGLLDFWTDGKMTVEAEVVHGISRKNEPCQEQYARRLVTCFAMHCRYHLLCHLLKRPCNLG